MPKCESGMNVTIYRHDITVNTETESGSTMVKSLHDAGSEAESGLRRHWYEKESLIRRADDGYEKVLYDNYGRAARPTPLEDIEAVLRGCAPYASWCSTRRTSERSAISTSASASSAPSPSSI